MRGSIAQSLPLQKGFPALCHANAYRDNNIHIASTRSFDMGWTPAEG